MSNEETQEGTLGILEDLSCAEISDFNRWHNHRVCAFGSRCISHKLNCDIHGSNEATDISECFGDSRRGRSDR